MRPSAVVAALLVVLSAAGCSTTQLPPPRADDAGDGATEAAGASIDRLHGGAQPVAVPGAGVGYATADLDPAACADVHHPGAAPIAVVTDVGHLVTYLSRESVSYCLVGGTPERPESCGAAPALELTRLTSAGRGARPVACDPGRVLLLVEPPDGTRFVVVDQGGWDGWFPVDGWATAVHGAPPEPGEYVLSVRYIGDEGAVLGTERAEGYVAG